MAGEEEAFVAAWMERRGIAQFSYDDSQSDELVLDWIKLQDAEAWHRYATTFNWDNGCEIAQWIAEQPGCDKGTALYLYHAASPSFYTRFESVDAAYAEQIHDEALDLMLSVCAGWSQGRYATYRFSPDWVFGDTMPASEADRLALAKAVPWEVPDAMASTGAEGSETGWEESVDGIPSALHEAIMARYEPWDDYKQATGTEDVFDVARRLGEAEMPSDDTPVNTRMMWVNYILALNAFGADSEHMALIPKPNLEGTGMPIGKP